ncbi:carboxymuconolactone decarboxylase family protein [Glycomyces tarimensis]
MSPSIRHITPVGPKAAVGVVADVYQQVESDLGATGGTPFAMLSPTPELLAPMWSLLRESLLVGGPRERVAKEVVATAIAVKNRCRFCADAHATMLHAAGEHEIAESLRSGEPPDEHADLAEWAVAPSVDGPFGAEAAPRFIGTALVFEFITRMVKVMAPDVGPHPSTNTKFGRSVASRSLRAAVAADLQPGASLPLLDRREPWLAELWPTLDLSVPGWAGDSPVGRAWAQLRATAARGRGLLNAHAAGQVEQAIGKSVDDWGARLVTGPIVIDDIERLPATAALGARLAASAALDPGSIRDEDVVAWRTGSVSDHCTVFMFAFAVGHLVDRIQSELTHVGLTAKGDVNA